jgi:hypothetical protein
MILNDIPKDIQDENWLETLIDFSNFIKIYTCSTLIPMMTHKREDSESLELLNKPPKLTLLRSQSDRIQAMEL